MKNLFLSVFCFFAISTLSAQTMEFAPIGTNWYYDYYVFNPTPPWVDIIKVQQLTVTAQEMYQGKWCSKIAGAETNGCLVENALYLHQAGDSIFFYSQVSQQFQLVYNFAAQPGDSWEIRGLWNSAGLDSLVVVVDSISTMTLSDGSVRTVQHLVFPWSQPYEWDFEIIEGIGNTSFLIPEFGLCEPGRVGIRCFTQGNLEEHFGFDDCNETIIINATDEAEKAVSLYTLVPNPATDHIKLVSTSVNVDLKAQSVILYDALGRVVVLHHFVGDNVEISLEGISPGFYSYTIKDARNMVSGKGKFVKM